MKTYYQRIFSVLLIFVFLFGWLGWDVNSGTAAAKPLTSPPEDVLLEDLLDDAPVIDVWYGPTQTFGNPANPQGQIAILGNVSAEATTLHYSLNGGVEKELTIGPDTRRLANVGDFAVELFDDELNGLPQTNTVEIIANSGELTETSVTVTVNYERWRRISLASDYVVDNWNNFLSQSQVVDGKWHTANTKLYTTEPGYDRMVAIGDMGWQDYEILAEIKPMGIDPACTDYDCGSVSFGPGIGLLARWTGHTDNPVAGTQPKSGWLPLGAIGWYRWATDGTGGFQIYHDADHIESSGESTLSLGVTYMFKFQVETLGDGSPEYRLKVWPKATSEPPAWNVTWQGSPDDPRSGSAVLFAHHVNAEFGEVRVRQLNPSVKSNIVFDDFNECALDPGVWQLYTPVNQTQTSAVIVGAFSGDAKLNISIPGNLPSDHNPDVESNQAARVRQTITDEDFHVEAKFDSAVNTQYQMQGIMVEGIDPNNFMRFEFYNDGTDTYFYARSFQGANSQEYANKVIMTGGSSPLYLRVFRSGDRWITGYSLTGNPSSWVTVATFPYMMDMDKIGLYAGNADAPSAPSHTAVIDYFRDADDAGFVDDAEVGDIAIDLTIVGNGTVTKNPDLAVYTCGQTVQLTANPAPGHSFVGWEGDLTGTQNPASVVMNRPKSITANFEVNTYLLSVTKTGTGTGTVTSTPAGIACGSDCSEEYAHGTAVTLTASEDGGSSFTGWSGAGCSGTGTCVVTMTEAKNVQANFLLGTSALVVEKAGDGDGLVTSSPAGINCGAACSASFTNGTSVTLTAMANSGSTFEGWSGSGCSGTGTCVVMVDAVKTVTATFTAIEISSYEVYIPLVVR